MQSVGLSDGLLFGLSKRLYQCVLARLTKCYQYLSSWETGCYVLAVEKLWLDLCDFD